MPKAFPDPQPCKFCNCNATYSPIPAMENYGAKIFFCHPCQAEYIRYTRGSHSKYPSVSLYVTIRDKMYRWTDSGEGQFANLWYVKEPGEPGARVNKLMVHLLGVTKDIPELTPLNIESKIRAWLPFL
jgi:hypothetical protein